MVQANPFQIAVMIAVVMAVEPANINVQFVSAIFEISVCCVKIIAHKFLPNDVGTVIGNIANSQIGQIKSVESLTYSEVFIVPETVGIVESCVECPTVGDVVNVK
jgi:hypothetical protein